MGKRFAHQRFADSRESTRKIPIFEALRQIRANRVFSSIRTEIRVFRVQSSLLIPFSGRSIRKNEVFSKARIDSQRTSAIACESRIDSRESAH